jgi:photosystem II stability/assembly factor-like uncharacterized protein
MNPAFRISLPVFIASISIVLFFAEAAFPQTGINVDDTASNPYWIKMMQDPEARFSATCSAFEKYWEARSEYKGNGWKVFRRWEYINSPRVREDGRLPSGEQILRETENFIRNNPVESASGTWSQTGPVSMPVNSTTQPTGLGRINALAFDPVNANTIFAGSPSGGLWKTTNGGSTWSVLTNSTPTLGVSAILLHPSNSSLILIGTGDRDAADAPGMGIYISTDGGSTWAASNSGMGNQTVGMMIRHPSVANTILAATSGGIYKSTDGGSSWSLKSSALNFKDIKFKPGTPSTVYATENGNFYKSTNTGDSWTLVTSGIVAGTRMVIGVSANAPNTVYLVQTNGPFAGLLKSTDSGQNFSTISTTPNLMDYSCNGAGTASQAWYNLCVAVDPSNAGTLYVGGINTWKSTNGGSSWTIVSHWLGASYGSSCAPSVHADIHCLEWNPVNGRLFSGNDGGVYWTANGGSGWTDISSGLAIAQVYKIGQSATNKGLVINGYQDNGTAINSGSGFTTVIGGDGMECIIDYSDSTCRFGSIYYGDIRRYYSSGGFSTIGKNGSNGITESGGWVTPFIQHSTIPSTLFAGYKNIWRTTNAKTVPGILVNWSAISAGQTTNCIVLEQSPANVDILYAVWQGSVMRSDNANAATPAWSTCTLPGGNTPTDLEAHPTNQNVVYATAGTKVYKSTNKGSSWSDISSNLPAITINCIVYDVNSNDGLYVGNTTQVFYRDAAMSTWTLYSSGLPKVDIRELEIFYSGTDVTQNRIKVATYGRGLWESDLYFTPTLAVTSPNGGEYWTLGTVRTISWSTNFSSNVKIELYKSGSFHSTIAASVVNNGVYAWNIPSTLPVGTDYQIKITGVSVTGVHDISNTNFNLHVANPTSNSPVCSGDTLRLSCTGMAGCGFPAAVYIWSAADGIYFSGAMSPVINPGDPSYTSQRFFVNITFPGGASTGFTDVTIHPPLNATVHPVNPLCYMDSNGSVSVIAAGAFPPFTYLWSTGATSQVITGLAAGNYSVTVTDNQMCHNSAGTLLTNPPPLQMTAALSHATCSGNNDGNIILTTGGGTGTLLCGWNTGSANCSVGNLTAGSYTVTVTDANQCSLDSTLVIIEADTMCYQMKFQNLTVQGGSTVCYNAVQTITLAGYTDNSFQHTTYHVMPGGDVTLIAGQNIFMKIGTSIDSGAYFAARILPSGPWCSSAANPVSGTASGKDYITEIHDVKVFPNPASNEVLIRFSSDPGPGPFYFEVWTLDGRKVISWRNESAGNVKFSVINLPEGLCFLKIFNEKRLKTIKIMIVR